MALREHEERALTEIGQHLAEDDPRLAARLTSGRTTVLMLSSRTQFVLGVLVTYVVGLLTIIAGVTVATPVLIGLGAAVTASFPVVVTFRALRGRGQQEDAGSPPLLDRRDELAE
jgi:hypothetical protein